MIELSRLSLRIALCGLLLTPMLTAFCSGQSPAVASKKIAQEARSILSNRCFACHGPDEAQVEAGLRLDDRTRSLALLDSGKRAIVPGKPSDSELMRRITSHDDSERMPPPKFADRLSEREQRILDTWIREGADLPEHWSFKPIQRPSLPAPEEFQQVHSAWHPIDRFVHAKLKEVGLAPSPEADRATLLRRLSLDLIGLPPTLEELDGFLADGSPRAYEDAVDRLLASPRFGEHWGRKWLDLARYADSAGYADDPPRTIWGYRDWVIRAFNRDLPFDQFTREQLAGDLLPNPTQDQLVATAFHRNTLTNNEGGTNDEEFRNVAIVDRVNTTMAVWMGMTMACAQCHNHKYDPLSQKDYFQIFAIFNQSQDADKRDESPLIELFTDEQVRDRLNWQKELESLEQKLSQLDPKLSQEQRNWESLLGAPVDWMPLRADRLSTASGDPIRQSDDAVVQVDSLADRDKIEITVSLPKESLASLNAIQIESIPSADLPDQGAGFGGGNFVISRVSASILKEKNAIGKGRFVRIELPGEAKILSLAEVEVLSEGVNLAKEGKATQSSTDFGGDAKRAIDGKNSGKYNDQSTTHTAISNDPWWEVDLATDKAIDKIVVHNRTDDNVFQRLDGAIVRVLDANRQELFASTIKKGTKKPMELIVVDQPSLEWVGAFADYEQPGFAASGVLDQNADTGWAVGGSSQTPHALTLTCRTIPERHLETDANTLQVRFLIECQSKHTRHVIGRFRLKQTKSPHIAERLRVPKDLLPVVLKSPTDRSEEESKRVSLYYQREVAPSLQATREQVASLQKKLSSEKGATTVPVMRDLPVDKHRRTFVHVRGNYRSEGESVQANLPNTFHPLRTSDGAKTNKPIDRLQLADWLMQKENPLTARVVVNRLWESLFGLGIVRSSEDFGSQGDLPSHPELLDWLACELQRQEWNMKSVLRTIVTSATYRQQSLVSPEQREADIDNVYLSRGPRVRLSAEQIRDQALAVSGLLSHRMYGEPVRPRQPNSGLKAAFGSATDWETSKGENSYRRGMYTVWRRSNPYPSMATFDAPNREVCTLRRDRTNTPLQALVTLNDPVFVEAAQALARRVVLYEAKSLSTVDQIRHAFRLVTSRYPSDPELARLTSLYESSLADFRLDPSSAKKLATDPLGPLPEKALPVDGSIDEGVLAAWTVVGNVLLNLDEVLMTR